MIPTLRTAFNASWTEAHYTSLLAHLRRRVGGSIEFPISETPCFFPRALLEHTAAVGEELVRQSLTGRAAAAAGAIIPERFRGPNQNEVPTFVQVDFGLVRNERGDVTPKLVELQAFPSLYGFQTVLARSYVEAFALPTELGRYLSGAAENGDTPSDDSYRRLVGQAILGGQDPREVVLMEIDPAHQKTRPDFHVTEQLWGVRAVHVGDVVRDGRRLFYRRDGVLTPIARVYNRVIPDELERKQIELPFDYRDDLAVEWAGHPAWFFRVSKFSMPFLEHPCVPRTWFLHKVDDWPDARERLLLKPLFSFAGGGIVFAPTEADLQAIPPEKRAEFILQERIAFEPIIATPDGPTQPEIRIMYVWTDRLRAVMPLVRMGRGKMMGVDHNKGLRWVGASAGLIADGRE